MFNKFEVMVAGASKDLNIQYFRSWSGYRLPQFLHTWSCFVLETTCCHGSGSVQRMDGVDARVESGRRGPWAGIGAKGVPLCHLPAYPPVLETCDGILEVHGGWYWCCLMSSSCLLKVIIAAPSS